MRLHAHIHVLSQILPAAPHSPPWWAERDWHTPTTRFSGPEPKSTSKRDEGQSAQSAVPRPRRGGTASLVGSGPG